MASLEEALKTHLESFAGLTTLIGTGANARLYPRVLKQGTTFPAVTYFITSGGSEYNHGGHAGKAETFIQIDAWGAGYFSGNAVAEQVRLAMLTFKGSYSGFVIDHADKIGVTDLSDPERTIYHRAMDYLVRHSEAAA